MTLELHLLGPFRLASQGVSLRRLRSGAGPRLLTLLALRHGQSVPRLLLAEHLWPDSTEEQALYNLRRNLTDLRDVLGDDAERLQTPTRAVVCLDLNGTRCDLILFDAAIKRGDRSALEEAIGLYGGPLLEGCDDEWALPERRQREAEYLRALETLATGAPPAEAVRFLRLLLAHDPAQEAAQRRLMRALAALGDHAGAARAYDTFRRTLKKELGMEPDERTAALARSIRAQGRRAVPTDASVTLSAGLHLPEPATALIGRVVERRTVAHALEESALVTLIGSGGVGKTRLALASARDAQGMGDDAGAVRFEGGVWFADLSAVSEPAQVAGAVAAALDVPPPRTGTYEEALTAHLGKKSLLLVLDNCEQVREAAAVLVGLLLRDCPGVRVLATSRVPLGLKPESTYRVPSLSTPPEATPSEALSGYAAVGLFLDRARAVLPRFALDEHTSPAVARICRLLDGIPLALELAANRIRTLTPDEIAAHLDQRFRLLTGTRPGALRRQQTLRGSLDWSWDLLDAPERAALSRLSVFAGSFSLEAAEAVLTAAPLERWEALDLMARLGDWGLLMVEAGEEGERTRLLETVRQYAAEKLGESGEGDAARDRHRDWFVGLVGENQAKMSGPESAACLRLFSADHANLRAALDWCAQREDGAASGVQMAGELFLFWNMRGLYTEGREILTRALAREGTAGTAARAVALYGAGMLAYHQGEYEAAQDFLEEALAIQRALGDLPRAANVLNSLGFITQFRGDYALARTRFEESLRLSREAGVSRAVAIALINLAKMDEDLGDFARSYEQQEQGLAILRSLNDPRLISMSLQNLGNTATRLGERARARELFAEALELCRSLGDMRNTAETLLNLGCATDELKEARAIVGQALEVYREIGDRFGTAQALNALGRGALSAGEPSEAIPFVQESLTIRHEIDLPSCIAANFECLAGVALAQGHPSRAARLLGAAGALRESIGAPLLPDDQEDVATWETQARDALGEAAYAVAWTEGCKLSREQAVAYALAEDA